MLFVQYELLLLSLAVMLFVKYESLNNLSKNYVIDCLHHLLPYVLHAEKCEWPEVLDIVR